MKCKDLLVRFRAHVCDFLISKFREAIEGGKDNNCVIEMIAETASVFELKDQKTFLQVSNCFLHCLVFILVSLF